MGGKRFYDAQARAQALAHHSPRCRWQANRHGGAPCRLCEDRGIRAWFLTFFTVDCEGAMVAAAKRGSTFERIQPTCADR